MPRLNLSDGVALNVEVQGQGPALLLLHGFTGAATSWARVRPALNEHYTTIAVDMLGHGTSDAPTDPARYRMAQCSADLAEVLTQLAVPHAVVLGYSMGGRVALHFALKHPTRVRALILESASPGLAEAAERAARTANDEALAQRIEQEGVEAFVAAWERLPLFATQARLPEAVQNELRAQRLRNQPQGLANSLRGLGTGVQPSLWAELSTLTTPTLVLAGELDTKFTTLAVAMARALTHAHLRLLPNAGHTLHLETPSTFVQAVVEFLQKQ